MSSADHRMVGTPTTRDVCGCGAGAAPELVWKCKTCKKDVTFGGGELSEEASQRVEERLNQLIQPCSDTLKNLAVLLVRGESSAGAEGASQPTIAEYKDAQKAAVQALTQVFGAFFEDDIANLRKKQETERRHAERKHLMDELASTESEYVADLQTLLDVWMPAVTEGKFFDAKQEALIFNMIKQIMHLSMEFSAVFSDTASKPEDEQRLGEALMKKVPFLRLYVEQTSGLCNVTEIVNEAAKSRRFQAMQRTVSADPRVKGLDLMSFLIMPMQRLARYPLLIQSLLKCTEETHPDYQSLAQVLAELRKVVAQVNDLSKLRMSLSVFSQLQHRMTWSSKSVDFVLSGAMHLCNEDASWELCKRRNEHTVVMKGNHILMTSLLVVLMEKDQEKKKMHEKKMFFPQELEILPEDHDAPNVLKINVRRIRKEYIEDKKASFATRRMNRSCSVSSGTPGAPFPFLQSTSGPSKAPKYVLHVNCKDFLDMQSWIMRFKDMIDAAQPEPPPLYPWNPKARANGIRRTTTATRNLNTSHNTIPLVC